MAHVKPTKYGMEMIKKTLDMLMGVNRNGDRPDAIIDSYRDRRVCKYDLVGLCPHQLFPNTRQHLGACKAQCCPAPQHLKQQFQEDLENDDPLCWRFVKDAERFYSDLVGKCDEKKQLHQFRLDEQNKQAGHVAPLENAELKATIERMEELTGLVEKLGEEGKIDEAQQRMQELDHLTKRKEELEAYIKPKTNQQELLVCDICAAILSVNETDQRLADHFAGKSHIGYVKLREKAKELGEKLKEHFEKSGGRANSYDSYQDDENIAVAVEAFERDRTEEVEVIAVADVDVHHSEEMEESDTENIPTRETTHSEVAMIEDRLLDTSAGDSSEI
eukprot:CAMPEP_0117444580 /NCGR_PEP_ID=MMETSP0759-20121206/5316_1 /TAXON_ID=63605 /ORGANISM="Percolomonas cosmopolitus, Strain WS" /LENGTH=331 /DNA_ID=CAMNT_0005236655 /DNA_START=90 /DNA_END=1086 /DNA_ORIENTATION=-